MKRTATVEIEKKYLIEIDEEVINDEFLEEFSNFFYDVEDLEDFTNHILQYIARFGIGCIEGIGCPLVDGKKPYGVADELINEAINVKVLIEEDIHIY